MYKYVCTDVIVPVYVCVDLVINSGVTRYSRKTVKNVCTIKSSV